MYECCDYQAAHRCERKVLTEVVIMTKNVLAAISKAEWVTTYGRIKKVQVIRIDDGVMYVKEARACR